MINTFPKDIVDVTIMLDDKFIFEQTTLPAKTSGFPMDSHFQPGELDRLIIITQKAVIEIEGEQQTIDLRT